MILEYPNDWLRLLSVGLKHMVEHLCEEATDAEVTFTARVVEPYNVFMSIDVVPGNDDEDEREISVYKHAELDAAVEATINEDYKSKDFADGLRRIAKEFRRHADRLDAAATDHESNKGVAA